jgi:hypothetical protein
MNAAISINQVTIFTERSLSEEKFLNKISRQPYHPLAECLIFFIHSLFSQSESIYVPGIKLACSILKFSPESQLAIILSDFIIKKFVKKMPGKLPVSLVEKKINHLTKAIFFTTRKNCLFALYTIPIYLSVNLSLIADPRIKLLNLCQKKVGVSLSVEFETLELKVAWLLEKYRRELLHRIIPVNEKNRNIQVAYIEKKLQSKFGLITLATCHIDEAMINKKYQRLSTEDLKCYLIHGIFNCKALHKASIDKRYCYSNAQAMIDYVQTAINEEENHSLKLSFTQRLTEGEDRQRNLHDYIDNYGDINRNGAKALLFSTGYLI